MEQSCRPAKRDKENHEIITHHIGIFLKDNVELIAEVPSVTTEVCTHHPRQDLQEVFGTRTSHQITSVLSMDDAKQTIYSCQQVYERG